MWMEQIWTLSNLGQNDEVQVKEVSVTHMLGESARLRDSIDMLDHAHMWRALIMRNLEMTAPLVWGISTVQSWGRVSVSFGDFHLFLLLYFILSRSTLLTINLLQLHSSIVVLDVPWLVPYTCCLHLFTKKRTYSVQSSVSSLWLLTLDSRCCILSTSHISLVTHTALQSGLRSELSSSTLCTSTRFCLEPIKLLTLCHL